MYRFKTKEEFIKEFGKKWRDKAHGSFVESMDYMLGTEITQQQYMDLQSYTIKIDNWTVSKDMVKEVFDILLYDTEPKSLADCHGWEFEATYGDKPIKGKITVEDWNGYENSIFLCQNVSAGANCKEKWGYNYSYIIPSENTISSISYTPFKNFKLLTKSKNVKKDSKSEVCRFDSQGEPRGTIITIHSKSVSPARGSRFVGRTATNFYTGTKADSGKVSYNKLQSI